MDAGTWPVVADAIAASRVTSAERSVTPMASRGSPLSTAGAKPGVAGLAGDGPAASVAAGVPEPRANGAE